jgi:DNA repair exonuclease SbcCD nuclease subunit
LGSFRFLHAADLHLDSPLIGLSVKSPEFAKRVETASRQAFDNLVRLALEEQCRFVVLPGDVFDRDLRNYQTGLYFLAGMKRLAGAGIDVFLVLGNHDAGNRFADRLAFSANVHLFSKRHAETRVLEDVGVAIHGRSFPKWDTEENLARDYPGAVPGMFNIGVLHTACVGSEGAHAPYAPCTIEQLANHGYDYWALGHVHGFAVLKEAPHIVYSGNLQGRDPRETGAKGAVLVTVDDGRVSLVEHRALDVVRWAAVTMDAASKADRDAMIDGLREQISEACAGAGDRAVALRVVVAGKTALHGELLMRRDAVREDIEALLPTLSHEIWLEKFVVRTEPPASVEAVDPTVAGRLDREISRLAANGRLAAKIDEKLADIRARLPAGAYADEFIERMRSEIAGRATDLARGLINEAGHAAD